MVQGLLILDHVLVLAIFQILLVFKQFLWGFRLSKAGSYFVLKLVYYRAYRMKIYMNVINRPSSNWSNSQISMSANFFFFNFNHIFHINYH